jgi:indole-3-acetate O-methyltransferase
MEELGCFDDFRYLVVQAQHARSMLHLLKASLDGVQLINPDVPFVLADLGCSCGSNTIYIIEVIIEHMSKRYEASGYEPPEFSAFFCDLPSNDFNTLFQLLPPYGGSMEECLSGVPGSFYRRLFPAKSIDIFYSAFSLHWLSQVILDVFFFLCIS